jgi:hypothetical protein
MSVAAADTAAAAVVLVVVCWFTCRMAVCMRGEWWRVTQQQIWRWSKWNLRGHCLLCNLDSRAGKSGVHCFGVLGAGAFLTKNGP